VCDELKVGYNYQHQTKTIRNVSFVGGVEYCTYGIQLQYHLLSFGVSYTLFFLFYLLVAL
jgi:hypothetical protein